MASAESITGVWGTETPAESGGSTPDGGQEAKLSFEVIA